MKKRLGEFLKSEDGQGMVEYGLIIGIISIAAIAVLVLMGPKLTDYFTDANDLMPAVD